MNEFKPGREDAIRIKPHKTNDEKLIFSLKFTEEQKVRLLSISTSEQMFLEEVKSLRDTINHLKNNIDTPQNINLLLISREHREDFKEGIRKQKNQITRNIILEQIDLYVKHMNYLINERRETIKMRNNIKEIERSRNTFYNRFKRFFRF